MPHIDGQSDSRLGEVGQPAADNLDESKLSADETVRLGQQAWNDDDAADDIATVMMTKLSPNKAERVARAILKKVKEKRTAQPKLAAQDAAASAEERKVLYAAE